MTVNSDLVLAIDIGATKLAVGLVGSDGAVIADQRAPTPPHHRDAIRELLRMGRAIIDAPAAAGRTIVAAGIACGGPLDLEKGLVLSPPNLPDWDRVALSALMRDAFGVPVHLHNDAAAGAFATYLWDNPREVSDVVYMTVSSGVGSGVISDGRLLTGARGNGSELGHIPLVWNGRRCGCGLSGCVEAYVSGTAIGNRFTEMRMANEVTARRFTAQDVAAMAGEGDAVAREFWRESMLMLRSGVTAAINLYDPELIVLGGGVTEAGDAALAPVLDLNLKGGALAGDSGRPVEVRRTRFGNRSGVIAAASVAWNALATGNARRVLLRRS